MSRSQTPPEGGSEAHAVDPLRLVEQYERPVYSFIRRSAPNDADAADLTQEVFAALIEGLPRYDARRPLAPWIFGIAANVVSAHFRRLSLRRSKERGPELARESQPREQEEVVESREVAAIVRSRLAALPDESRMLVVLQYYHDFSQRDIAGFLNLPRTTVRDRIRNALSTLENDFRSAGYVAAIPLITPSMREADLLTVPTAVQASLRGAASATAVGTTASTLTASLGGTIIMKKIIASTVVIVAALTLGVGIGQGDWIDSAAKATESGQLARVRLTELEEQNEFLARELETARQKLRAMKHETESLAGKLQAKETASAAPVANDEPDPETGVASTVNWDAFAQAFSRHRRILAMLATKEQKNLSPAEEVALYKLRIDLELAAAELRKEYPYPVLEPEVLPRYLDACLGGLLELDEEQRAILARAASEALANAPALNDVSLFEAYDFRRDVFEHVTGRVDTLLDEDQLAHWNELKPLWRDLSEGNHRMISVGVEGTNIEDRIVQEWATYYDLSEAQASRAQSHSRRMLEAATAIIEPHLRDRIRRGQLDDETKLELERAFRQLQLEADRSIAAGLHAEQIRRARERLPLLFEFEIGTRIESNVENGRGF